ncbi:MAG TPA: BrnA antitoxin family protein [Acetobacteraceae bacterium]
MVKLGAPQRRRAIHIRLAPEVLRWFKALGPGYQTRINAVLRAFVEARRKGRMLGSSKSPRTADHSSPDVPYAAIIYAEYCPHLLVLYVQQRTRTHGLMDRVSVTNVVPIVHLEIRPESVFHPV